MLLVTILEAVPVLPAAFMEAPGCFPYRTFGVSSGTLWTQRGRKTVNEHPFLCILEQKFDPLKFITG